jgi:uncharacterized protein
MSISFDPSKRDITLAERGLDFADALDVLAGAKFQFVDDRSDYGEERITTIGMLLGRMVVLVWTRRESDVHIISLRKANDREQRKYKDSLG